MARASGANSRFILGMEASYGAMAAALYFLVPFVSSAIGGDQALIKNNLLGRGRNPGDPILDVVNDAGDVTVPVDVRNIWLWFYLLMGAPVTTLVKAAGSFDFSAQPVATSTISVGGTTWTFVTGAPAGNQIQIGANLAATMTAAATALNASADVQTVKATYTGSATGLAVEFDTAGAAGNAFTLAASANSNATPSGANLTGGGYQHVFTSGAASLPSAVAEVGFPEVPSYGRNGGIVANSIKISLAASGLLDAVISLIGQKETTFAAPITATPVELAVTRFGQLTGEIKRNGARLAGITSGDFTLNNTYDAVRVIRPDGAIDGADVGVLDLSGTITARFSDTVLLDQAASGLPCDISYGWSTPLGYSLMIGVDRIFLPRPKRSVSGPTGIEVPYAWQAGDSVCTVTLINDQAATVYLGE